MLIQLRWQLFNRVIAPWWLILQTESRLGEPISWRKSEVMWS